ncbi:GAD-like domain-containing protein [Fulvimarina sp. MAC3]|uniref:GAD-like domain-containing protein n=1 Tax=Fulvimarina sp. MAC3 TaxID=3148887 RepID=UPI0031FCBE95
MGEFYFMDSFFGETIDDFGPPQRAVHLTLAQRKRLATHLPASFVEFVSIYGFGDYFNRKIQYCDPAPFSSILALVFQADPDFSHNDCFVVAYSAFGRLICWSKRHDHFEIDLVDQRVTSSKLAPTYFTKIAGLPKREWSNDPNVLARSLLPFEESDYEEFDATGEPMFARCVAAHGSLNRGECYGYFPAVALAGIDNPKRRLENIQRVQALEHFTLLAQLGSFYLMQLERGRYTAIREIG